MNCISGSFLLSSLIACSACGAPASESDRNESRNSYSLHYTISPEPEHSAVRVSLKLSQSRGQLRELSFSSASIVVSDLVGDGDLTVDDGRVVWQPARSGGTLSWRTIVRHERNNNGFDALLDSEWGVFRAEDVIPRARSRTLVGAASTTTMSFQLPRSWSVITEYSGLSETIVIDNPARRFDQPTGWIALGQLGVRRETIAGTRVIVAAREGQSVRRMDMLALLNWTLPELATLLPDALPRLTVVSAADPMWRGGLSAPASIFIHADRPLISENATSTLVHEVMHVALRFDADYGYDWITEGLAEYYSLELLLRGGAITKRRYKVAIADQLKWANDADGLCGARSSGPTTALAVTVFRDLDEEIRKATAGESGLDDVVTQLLRIDAAVDLDQLRIIAAKITGKPPNALHIDKLPGCSRITTTLQT